MKRHLKLALPSHLETFERKANPLVHSDERERARKLGEKQVNGRPLTVEGTKPLMRSVASERPEGRRDDRTHDADA